MIKEKGERQGRIFYRQKVENMKLKETYIGTKDLEKEKIREHKIEISVHGGEYTIRKEGDMIVMLIGLREEKRIKTLVGTKIISNTDKSIILSNIWKKKLSEECNRILKIKDLKKNRGKGIKIRYIE